MKKPFESVNSHDLNNGESRNNDNHFTLKKASEDFLDVMRSQPGKRSQTTKRLIRKIQQESSKSKRSNFEGSASLPTFNSAHHDLSHYEPHEEDKQNEKHIEEEPYQDGLIKKTKPFEYSVHKVEYSKDKHKESIQRLIEASDEKELKQLILDEELPIEPDQDQKQIKTLKPTASANINPLIESTNSDVAKKFTSSKSDEDLINEPIKPVKLSYDLPEVAYSQDMFDGNNPQMQAKIIYKLNSEMQKLLSTLTQVDNE